MAPVPKPEGAAQSTSFLIRSAQRNPQPKGLDISPKLRKWVTHRVGRFNRDKIIDTWKCGNDPASPVRAHSPQEQEAA